MDLIILAKILDDVFLRFQKCCFDDLMHAAILCIVFKVRHSDRRNFALIFF